jgi:ribosomal protein S1
VVEGTVTAVTNFGVFISFGEDNKMEGLIHISELDWKRIDDPSELYQVGDEVKAEIIALEDSKIFLSAKKLKDNPWKDVDKKYQVGQVVRGEVLKVNPFGLFVKLSEDIHGLAHVSQLGMTREEKIEDKFKVNEEYDFEITSLVPKEHRLGLRYVEKKEGKKKDEEVKKDDSQEKLDSEEEKAEKKAENKKQEQDPDKDKNDKTQSQKTKKASSKPTSKASEDDKNDKEESDS